MFSSVLIACISFFRDLLDVWLLTLTCPITDRVFTDVGLISHVEQCFF